MANVEINLVPNSNPCGNSEYTVTMKRDIRAANVQPPLNTVNVVSGQAVPGETVTVTVPYDATKPGENKISVTTALRNVDVANVQRSLNTASEVAGQSKTGETCRVGVPFNVGKPGKKQNYVATAVRSVDVEDAVTPGSVVADVLVCKPYTASDFDQSADRTLTTKAVHIADVQLSPGTAEERLRACETVVGKPVELSIPYAERKFDQSKEHEVTSKAIHATSGQLSPGSVRKIATARSHLPESVETQGSNICSNTEVTCITGVRPFAPVTLRIQYDPATSSENVTESTLNLSGFENVPVTEGITSLISGRQCEEFARGDNLPVTVTKALAVGSLNRTGMIVDPSEQSTVNSHSDMEINQVVTAEIVKDISVTYQTTLDTEMESWGMFALQYILERLGNLY